MPFTQVWLYHFYKGQVSPHFTQQRRAKAKGYGPASKRRGKKKGEKKTSTQYTLHTIHTIHTIRNFEYWTLRGGTGTEVVTTELRVRMEGTGTSQQDLHDARFSIQVHLNIDMEGSTAIRVHM